MRGAGFGLQAPGSRSALLVVIVALGGFGCAGTGDDDRRPPRIEFENARHDFGQVDQGSVVDAEFAFRNGGEFDLEIADLRAAADCAARVDGQTRIRPGRSGVIRASFETGAVFGPQQRSVTVYSNDPEQRMITLELRGEVLLDIAADPPRLYAGPVLRGAPVPRAIAVRAEGATRVTAVRTSEPLLKAELLEAADVSSAPIVAVAISADAPLGPFGADVELVTTSARHPVLRVPVSGIVAPDVSVSPAQLQFGPVGIGTAPSRLLMVQNLREGRPVRLTAVEMEERLGTARVEPLAEGLRFRVKTTLSDRLPAGRFTGVVRLRTDHPEQSTVEVPIDGEVVGGDGG